MNRRFSWQPQWVRRNALSTPNVWGTRIAGAVAFVIGVTMLIKNGIKLF